VIAGQQLTTVQEQDRQNRELLDLSKQILKFTKAAHAYVRAQDDRVTRPRAADTAAGSSLPS
jgi:hypothetical protein